MFRIACISSILNVLTNDFRRIHRHTLDFIITIIILSTSSLPFSFLLFLYVLHSVTEPAIGYWSDHVDVIIIAAAVVDFYFYFSLHIGKLTEFAVRFITLWSCSASSMKISCGFVKYRILATRCMPVSYVQRYYNMLLISVFIFITFSLYLSSFLLNSQEGFTSKIDSRAYMLCWNWNKWIWIDGLFSISACFWSETS